MSMTAGGAIGGGVAANVGALTLQELIDGGFNPSLRLSPSFTNSPTPSSQREQKSANAPCTPSWPYITLGPMIYLTASLRTASIV